MENVTEIITEFKKFVLESLIDVTSDTEQLLEKYINYCHLIDRKYIASFNVLDTLLEHFIYTKFDFDENTCKTIIKRAKEGYLPRKKDNEIKFYNTNTFISVRRFIIHLNEEFGGSH